MPALSRLSLIALLTVLAPPALAASEAVDGEPPDARLDLAARASYHRAIEAVRHRHRDWPAANAAPRPALDELAPADLFAAKAADAARKSHALERFWGRPIGAPELQAEIERMARSTKQPERLEELWAALGNDPYRVAEILARPPLADRLIRERYAHDERFHGRLEALARAELAAAPTAEGLASTSGRYSEIEITPETAAGRRTLDEAVWDEQLELLGRRFGASIESLAAGAVSGLREDAVRFYVLAILERGDDRLRLASVEWPKEAFETWWARVSPGLPVEIEAPVHPYRLPAIAGEACADDTWRPTLAIPDPRYEHTAVWTGAEMIVWGGMSTVGTFPERGGRYEPATDTWTLVGEVGEPGLRAQHTAVWTGTEMIVWGGIGEDPGNTGGRYDPLTDTWQPTRLAGAPSPRASHVATWTGTEMLIWGGGGGLSSGGRYHPATNSWRPTTLAGAPEGRDIATVVWTGEEMIVWGGFRDPFTLDTGGRYDPVADSWQATSLVGVPSFRHFHTAVWTGEEMIVWGGVGEGFGTSTGGRYDPQTDSWRATRVAGAPSPRWLQEAVWTGKEMIIWGGAALLQDHPVTGGRYDPLTDSWTTTSLSNVPEGREDAASVWTGSELILWGGLGDVYFVNTGGRYDPAADSWLPTQTYNVPTARGLHTAAWTGSEMMIYGGDFLGEPGALYEPATDTWRPASEANAPRGIQNMTSVWTGSEVIVWGGFPETDEGGRYDPLTDSWTPTTTVGAPSERYAHSAVWTGTEMIIWGGWPVVDTGARYDPATDRWTATSTAGAPAPRDSHAAVWTGIEMVVWGGYPEVPVGQTGGRYDPATDSWQPTTTAGAPTRRSDPSAVWTGREMIVWGGYSFQDFQGFDTGGRYDPTADRWRPTAIEGAPSERVTPAVWTGEEMIVWGGVLTDSTGGRYNPLGDNWVPTSLEGAPRGRWNTTMVWTGDEALVWGGIIETATGGLYCARLEGNQTPIARPDAYEMVMGATLLVPPPGVLANDTDGDGDPLRARPMTRPANGRFKFRQDGAFGYRPHPSFAGFDSFIYRAADGQAPSDPATVTIAVACVTNCLRSVNIVIDLLFEQTRSRIWVETETGAPAAGASVSVTWTLPNGFMGSQTRVTDGAGMATFTIPDDSFGIFRIRVDDIRKTGFTFDPVNSVLTHAASR